MPIHSLISDRRALGMNPASYSDIDPYIKTGAIRGSLAGRELLYERMTKAADAMRQAEQDRLQREKYDSEMARQTTLDKLAQERAVKSDERQATLDKLMNEHNANVEVRSKAAEARAAAESERGKLLFEQAQKTRQADEAERLRWRPAYRAMSGEKVEGFEYDANTGDMTITNRGDGEKVVVPAEVLSGAMEKYYGMKVSAPRNASKEAMEERRRIASGKIGLALAGHKGLMSDQEARFVADAYVEGTPDEQAGILKYVEDLGKHQTAKTQYEKMMEALSIVDQSKTAPDRWYRAGKVFVDRDPGPGVSPSLVSTEVAKQNPNWKIITTDESGQTLIGGVPVVAPEEPKLTFGGLVGSDAVVRPPSARGGGAAAPMAPTMDQNIVTRMLKDGTTVRVRRTANGWEEVE